MSRDNYWESPFGKIQPRRQETPKLRGCGDPDCPQCNPETAAARARGEGRAITNATLQPADIYREISQRSVFSPDRIFEYASLGEAQRVEKTRPDPQIRKKVEHLIVRTAQTVRWDEVVGNEAARVALIQAVEAATTHKDLYEHYGMKAPRGVLLYGPPGCGKTMFAKAAAARLDELYGGGGEMISLSSSAIQSPLVGVTEAMIKAVFDYAREYRRVYGRDLVVFIDECDVLFPNRQSRRTAPWEDSQIAAVLEGLDGIESCGAFIILATNLPDRLDPALIRDGRVDRKIKIERPGHDETEEIVRRTLKGAPLIDSETVDEIARYVADAMHAPEMVLDTMTAVNLASGHKTALNFTLADIVSGAMATGIVSKMKSFAFERDMRNGSKTGLGRHDAAAAVAATLAENKDVSHSYAMAEFLDRHRAILQGAEIAERRKSMN